VYISLVQDNRVEWLASGEFAYNNREHTSTKHSPFFLEYGRHPIIPAKPQMPMQNPSTDEFVKNLETAREAARRALEDTAERMKKYADQRRSEEKEFQIGDKVWLDAEYLNTGRPSKTLDNRREGPFPVIGKAGKNAYRLRLPASWRVHPVFHVSHLRPANLNADLHPRQKNDEQRPSRIVIDGTR
jgi:hypothetical protein